MYPSTNNDGNISLTSINVQPMMLSSLYNYDDDANLSKPFREYHCPPSSSSFHLSSPHYITLEDETIYNDLLQQENYLFSHDHNDTNDIGVHQQYYTDHDIRARLQSAMGKCSNNNGKLVAQDGDGDINDGLINIHLDPKSCSSNKRRRTSKKDRHSKIETARGPRDRRMRLSIDVAKKFFKLQDMLGFDKASKTVEWLLMKSKSGIQELLPQKLNLNFRGVSNSASSTSKVDNQCMVNEDDEATPEYQKSSSSSNSFKDKKKSTTGGGVRKSAHHLHSPLAKETRERARARARERTVEKSSKLGLGGDHQCSSKSRPCLDQVIDQYLHLLGPSSTIHDQPEQQISHLQFKQGINGDNSSLMTANWSPSFLFNYQHIGFGAFPHDQHQFNDFELLGNLWEGKD